MKDWQNIYEEKHKQLKGWGFSYVINSRILRYKVNPPITNEHISELEFLIIKYDYHKTLLRRYEHVISDKAKNKWLDNFYEPKGRWNNSNHKFHSVLIPFYLINPKTDIERVDKHFLNDQILMSLGSLDHKFKKYRLRANYLLEFLPLKFMDLKPNIRIRIIEVLSSKANRESIKQISQLIYKYQKELHPDIVLNFVGEQISKNIINDKMAIGYLRRFQNNISSEMKAKLESKIRRLNNSELILNTIKSS